MKVIVSDVESRKAFDIANILQNKYKIECVLCSGKDYRWKLPLIYRQRIHPLRCGRIDEFIQDFKRIISLFPKEMLVYLPVSEQPTRFLYKFLAGCSPTNLRYLLPTENDFKLTADKKLFQQFCAERKFPVPKTFDWEELIGSNNDFAPVLLKPKHGQGSVGIRYIEKREDLKGFSPSSLNDYIIQEKVTSNQKVSGAFFLCQHGEVISSYTHQRLRTFPENGGVTVVSKSTWNEEILRIGAKVLKALDWNGVAMIEFMYDEKQKEWKIIELNPRLWGSIMLAPFAGNHVLKQYIDVCTGQSITPSKSYTQEKWIRWIFPFDFLNWIKGSISLKEFLSLNLARTCYINFTYASLYRALLYLLYFTFSLSSIKRFLKKVS